jgi:hypothetical protein
VEIINLASNSVPLSTTYVGDDDLYFLGFPEYSEEGLTFIKENYLNNASQNKINNYSSLYLTDKQNLDKILGIHKLPVVQEHITFNTTLQDSLNNNFLTISSGYVPLSSAEYYTTKINTKFVEESDRIFEITLLDSVSAKIIHNGKNRITYYLNYIDSQFYFLSTDDNVNNVFNYILDKKNNKLSLFIKNKLVFINNDNIFTLDEVNEFRNINFNINYYIQELNPKLNGSWVSYNTHHKNKYEIVPFKSRGNLPNNSLISSQYSHVTGNKIEANILVLKNQKTNKNYNYRSDYTENANENVPVVDNRSYVGLFTGNNQEKGDYAITLSYEFYNADYRFKSDEYTPFISPESMYPYKQINVNDLKLKYIGSIAGENPYMADKIFQKRDSNFTAGQYLCSWLHKDKYGGSTWLDRYYYPEKVSYSNALKTSFNYTYIDPLDDLIRSKLLSSEYYDVPFVYNTLEEEAANTPQTDQSALYGIAFFDKRSDLVLKPNTEYIYHRIGNKYVSTIIDNLKEYIVKDGLDLVNSINSPVYVQETDIDKKEYILDNKSHAKISKYENINISHQFTASFWLKSDNWENNFGHQIIGNLNNKGFALIKDPKITPFIMIQNNKSIYIYNTNFDLVDIGSLENENIKGSKIKDIYRTDHLDSFYAINTIETENGVIDAKKYGSSTSEIDYKLPKITKFYSNAAIYDGLGDPKNSYLSLVQEQNNIYFLLNTDGDVIRHNTITEESVFLKKYYTNLLPPIYTKLTPVAFENVLIPYGLDALEIPTEYKTNEYIPYGLDNKALTASELIIDNFIPARFIYKKSQDEKIYSMIKHEGSLYGFNGYDVKKFTKDSVMYVDNKSLIQESFDGSSKTVHLTSKTEIRDFILDDNLNYYVIHNTNMISKFTKDRVFQYSIKVEPNSSSNFTQFSLTPFNGVELLKMDIVREYTDNGLKTYPIVLGKIKNRNSTLSANQMFLAKLDEINKTVTDIKFTSLTGEYHEYGHYDRVNYNLTNYNYLINRYKTKDELLFKFVLQNAFNNRDKMVVEIPIDISNFTTEYHHFAIRADGKDGYISIYCDGKEIKTANIQPAQYIFQEIFSESINVGNTYFYNDQTLGEYLLQPNYYHIRDCKIKQFKLYDKALSESEILFHVYNGIHMKDLIVSLPCDQRNELDGIERQFKLDTTGSKSNKINILLKNSQITNTLLQTKIANILEDKLKKVLPITTTINKIEFR